MDLQLQDASKKAWHVAICRAHSVSLQQDWAYGDAVAYLGQRVHRFFVLDGDRRRLGAVQLAERGLFGGLSVLMLMRGPVWFGQDDRGGEQGGEARETAMIACLRQRFRLGAIMYTPEIEGGGARRCGLHRVMTGYSTILIDLTKPLDELRAGLHGKWRNMLKRAEAERFEIREARSGLSVDWLIGNNERYRRRVGYRSAKPPFYQALGAASMSLKLQSTYLAVEGDRPVAGVMMQRHGNAASYMIGYTSSEGRRLRAHHRLLWHACCKLKERGVKTLDLGGVETVHAAGLARFKLGMGGRLLTLAGTYMIPPRWR